MVRIGDPSTGRIDRPGVVDLATSAERSDLLECYCVARSDFFIGGEPGSAILAWISGKPALTLNATVPVGLAYPVHGSDIFTLKRVRDRIDGYALSPLDMLTREYLARAHDTERYDYFDNSPEDVLDAVKDIIEIVEHGVGPETPEQREFRLRALGVGVRAVENPEVRELGPHQGFLGRGRIAPSFARKYVAPQLR